MEGEVQRAPVRAGQIAAFAAATLFSSGCVISYDDELNPPRALYDPKVVTGPLDPSRPDPLDVFKEVVLPDGRVAQKPSGDGGGVVALSNGVAAQQDSPIVEPAVDAATQLASSLPLHPTKRVGLEWVMEKTKEYWGSGSHAAPDANLIMNPAALGMEFWQKAENIDQLKQRVGIDLKNSPNDRSWFQGHFLQTFMTALIAGSGDLQYARLALYEHVRGDMAVNMLPSLRDPILQDPVQKVELAPSVWPELPAAPTVSKEAPVAPLENEWVSRLRELRDKTPLTNEQKEGFDWFFREVRSDILKIQTAQPNLSQQDLLQELSLLWLPTSERGTQIRESLGIHLRYPPDLFWLRSHLGRVSDLVALQRMLGGSEEQFQVALWQQCVLDCPFPENMQKRYRASLEVLPADGSDGEIRSDGPPSPPLKVERGELLEAPHPPPSGDAPAVSEVPRGEEARELSTRGDGDKEHRAALGGPTSVRAVRAAPDRVPEPASSELPRCNGDGGMLQSGAVDQTRDERRSWKAFLWAAFTAANLLGAFHMAKIYVRTSKERDVQEA